MRVHYSYVGIYVKDHWVQEGDTKPKNWKVVAAELPGEPFSHLECFKKFGALVKAGRGA